MTISFGVEFEFDLIQPNNNRYVSSGLTPHYLSPNWGYQHDPTATMELRSPVFTSLDHFISEVNNQFSNMLERDHNHIPYPFNDRDRSLGQHIHIGKPNERLTSTTKAKIAKKVVVFYPLLAALHAQPIPSHRGLTTLYARSLAYYHNIISTDHYCEISDSHNGTVEFRLFDSNIPQASLTCAWIITQLAEKALSRSRRNSENHESNNVDLSAYDQERNKALRYGLVALEVTQYLKKLKEALGVVEIPNIASIKEALYLLARYRLNFYGVFKYVNAKPYDYCKAQYQDCSKFLENLLTIENLQHEDKVRNWINEAQQIENLDQLIGLSIAVDRSLAQRLTEAVEDRAVAQPSTSNTTTLLIERGLGRSVVREAIQNGSYQIVRIAEVRGLSVDEVADHISRLLTQHGEGLVNILRPIEIIRSPSRFYVFVAQDRHSNQIQICGAIAIHVNTGEISSLVVDRRYRRLGISRLLLQHVINVARERGLNQVHAYVRKNNEAAIALNLSLGFTERSRTNRSILFVKELRG